ncbi:MAG TPA: P-loop NTPase, partial [Nitrospiraceae bacterium]|nr:P-loop NTPase [Nitrospiraceae bacterium]
IGGKGGVGTSTVALNLAASLQKAGRQQSVALVDLDLESDDLALFLDLAATRGIRELVQDLSRLDQTILQSMLVKHKSGVQLLSSGSQEVGEAPPPPGCILHTIGLLRLMFGCVVLDCGHRINPSIQEALDLSSRVLVVTTLSVPSIRRAKRLVQHLQHSVAGRMQVSLVVNRYRSDEVDLLKEAESILKLKASWLIGNDYRTTSQALDAGVPLVDMSPHAEVSQQYGRQAAALLKEMAPHAVAGSTKELRKKDSLRSKYWPLFSSG